MTTTSTRDPRALAEALRASEQRHAAMLDAALDAVVSIDGDGLITGFNRAAERIFGRRAKDVLGVEMARVIVPPHLRDAHRRGFRRHLEGGPPSVLDRRIEITGMRAGGEEFPVELTVTRVAADPAAPASFIGYIRDITQRKRADDELRASRARIVEAADAARRRLERDLHDGAQQRLVGLAVLLRLSRIRAVVPEVQALLDDAIAEVVAATADLRELARGLHPAVLTEGGLRHALASLAARSAVPVRLEAVPGGRYAPAVEATAYFVVAEALTNIAKHAGATLVDVAVAEQGRVLVVTVRDDGAGGASVQGPGLRGLADRVAALDGAFSVQSPAGGGTVVRAEVPCVS